MKALRKKIKKYLSLIGLFYTEGERPDLAYEIQGYQLTENLEKIKSHRDFLLNLENQEDKRLDTIESKTSNLIAQTAIVFSLLGLFIPLLIDKASSFNICLQIALIVPLFLSSFFYLLTIHNALKNYQIHRFKYVRSVPKNVMDLKDESLEKFIAEEVRDLLLAVPENRHINNRKGNYLLHSYTAFRLANITTGILIATFAVSILFYRPEKNTITINEPIEIKKIDSLIKYMKKQQVGDTLTIKLKDSIYTLPAKK